MSRRAVQMCRRPHSAAPAPGPEPCERRWGPTPRPAPGLGPVRMCASLTRLNRCNRHIGCRAAGGSFRKPLEVSDRLRKFPLRRCTNTRAHACRVCPTAHRRKDACAHSKARARNCTRTRTRISTHPLTHARKRTHTRTHACIHTRTRTRTHAQTHKHPPPPLPTHTHTHTHAHMHAHTRTRTYARIHTHTHTHARALRCSLCSVHHLASLALTGYPSKVLTRGTGWCLGVLCRYCTGTHRVLPRAP
jgi:hypothetical protein